VPYRRKKLTFAISSPDEFLLCHVTLNLAETSVVKSRPSVPYGATLFS